MARSYWSSSKVKDLLDNQIDEEILLILARKYQAAKLLWKYSGKKIQKRNQVKIDSMMNTSEIMSALNYEVKRADIEKKLKKLSEGETRYDLEDFNKAVIQEGEHVWRIGFPLAEKIIMMGLVPPLNFSSNHRGKN